MACSAETAPQEQNVAIVQDTLNARFPATIKTETPGFALHVSKTGKTLFETTQGMADMEQARPIQANTVFHIASLSKQITGAALAHAILDQKISLDDPVSRWIPETGKYGADLKVAHLVYMTSGLTEYTSLPGPGGRPWITFHYFTVEDAIAASLSVDELQFTPGSRWQYSNINYMLLTKIIEAAYETSFSNFVDERLFKPLGMTASLINDDITTIIPNRANAYLPRETGVINELKTGGGIFAREGDHWLMVRRNAPHYGGSGVMSTIADWAKWQNELLTHNTFGDDFWAVMLARREFSHDKTNDAFGLVHGMRNDKETIWYSGGDIDTSAYSIAFPAEEFVITCFSNNPLDSCEQKTNTAIKALVEAGAL